MLEKEILFYHPIAAFLLLVLLPLLGAVRALQLYRREQMEAFNLSSPSRLLTPRSSRLTSAKWAASSLVWILACFALMGPYGNVRFSHLGDSKISHDKNPRTVIFLIDQSPSMNVPDGNSGKTRLEEAKSITEDLIRQLHGPMIAIYSFASKLSLAVPPTLDYIYARLIARELQIDRTDEGGTLLASALKSLKETLSQSSPKNYSVVLLTDGGDTQLELAKGAVKADEKRKIAKAIDGAQELSLQLFTVGIGGLKAQKIPEVTYEGKPVFSKLEEGVLREIAKEGSGTYYRSDDWSSWDLASQLARQIDAPAPLSISQPSNAIAAQEEESLVDLYYQIPLGLALLFYLLYFLLPDVRQEKL